MPAGALGLLETKGITNAVLAADTMLKTSRIELVDKKEIGGGIVTIIIRGEHAAVQAAVEAGEMAVSKMGGFVLSKVISNPDKTIDMIINK